MRGEPGQPPICEPIADGLSPRARGTPFSSCISASARRPIPACAGNPLQLVHQRVRPQAYPRVRGEPQIRRVERRRRMGLSPRARGTPMRSARPPETFGPIPACARNPCKARAAGKPMQTYPRVRGEPGAGRRKLRLHDDLSPRARGTPNARECRGRAAGPIPACAGNP